MRPDTGRLVVIVTDAFYPEVFAYIRERPQCTAVFFNPAGIPIPGIPGACFGDLIQLKEHVAMYSPTGHSLELWCPNNVLQVYRKIYNDVYAVLNEARPLMEIRHNTLKLRQIAATKCFVRNTAYLSLWPWITRIGKPFSGLPVFVVGAGPSLDKNIDTLKEAQKRGPVIVSNSALPAAVKYIEPDLHVSIESLNTNINIDQLNMCKALALCMSSNSVNFKAQRPGFLFTSGMEGYKHFLSQFGYGPTAYGQNVSSAATVLARELGASAIVLLGQDLSYPGGKVYADAVDRPVVVTKNKGLLERSDIEAQNKKYLDSGLNLKEQARDCLYVDGYYGGKVETTADMMAFHGWFQKFALDNPLLTKINSTEGGANIPGWENVSLADALKRWPQVEHDLVGACLHANKLSPKVLEAARGKLRRSAEYVVSACRGALAGKRHALADRAADVMRALHNHILLRELCAPAIMTIQDEGPLTQERGRRLLLGIAKTLSEAQREVL